jgi:CRISPR system Cascade subunit CasA
MNVLLSPIFTAALCDGSRRTLTLPGLYTELMRDGVAEVPAARPHQRQALHAFLAQIGALALIHAKRDNPPETEAEWTGLLRGLTPKYTDDEPWSLIVEDVSKPALLQPPIRECDPASKIDPLSIGLMGCWL